MFDNRRVNTNGRLFGKLGRKPRIRPVSSSVTEQGRWQNPKNYTSRSSTVFGHDTNEIGSLKINAQKTSTRSVSKTNQHYITRSISRLKDPKRLIGQKHFFFTQEVFNVRNQQRKLKRE